MSKYTENQLVEMAYQYLVEGMSQQAIVDMMGLHSEWDVSNELKPFGITGKANNAGRKGWDPGNHRGIASYAKMGFQVTRQDIYDFMFGSGKNMTDSAYFAKLKKQRMSGMGYSQNGMEEVGSWETSSQDSASSASGMFSGLISVVGVVILIAVILWLISFVKDIFGFAGAGKVGKLRENFGSSYEIDSYEYNGAYYIGGKSLGKPRGVNIETDSKMLRYQMGEFKSGKKSGEGAKNDGSLTIGLMKKDVFTKSWCVKKSGGDIKLAYFKKGQPTGVGIHKNSGVTQIVNYSKGEKVIATYKDGNWVKQNGKNLKLKNGKYKNIELISDTNMVAGGIRFTLDSIVEYDSGSFHFRGYEDVFAATYYSRSDNIDITFSRNDTMEMKMGSMTRKLWMGKSGE